MRNPYISIFSTQNLPEKAKELDTLWERFVTNASDEVVSKSIRNSILASWKRCQSTGVDPKQTQTKPTLTFPELNALLKESELFQAAKPLLDDLFYKLTGTGYLAALADQNGQLIYLKGDPAIIHEAEKMNFAHGMDWSENTAGTNAIGTSILTKNPIQIFSAEHFCQGCHPWTCSSAPIIHPFTKEVIGAIDFTGLRDDAQPHTLGLAISVAKAIEMELSHVYMKVNQFLSESFYKAIQKWKNNQILIINHAFFIANATSALTSFFKLSTGRSIENVPGFQSLASELVLFVKSPDKYHMLQEIIIQDFTVTSIEPIFFQGTIAGYMVILKDTKQKEPPSSLPILKSGTWTELIGQSKVFLSALSICRKAAVSNVSILLLGESGTGKEKIARMIHQSSRRADKPFIAINCGAIQKELIGSELFGYEGGTFTGAAKEGKKGKFEEANGGTLFLDEIGEMPLELQVHLLRVLQEKEITRLGSSKTISVNVRIVAATNQNLYDLCKKGLFREDLLYRLNVVTVTIPPLRERMDDIPPLTAFFLHQFSKLYDKTLLSLSDETLAHFHVYHWPGNIRELQNILEHAAIFSDSSIIHLNNLPGYFIEKLQTRTYSVQQHEGSYIENEEQKILLRFLEETGWNLSAVAKKMKIARTTLYRKLKKYQIKQK